MLRLLLAVCLALPLLGVATASADAAAWGECGTTVHRSRDGDRSVFEVQVADDQICDHALRTARRYAREEVPDVVWDDGSACEHLGVRGKQWVECADPAGLPVSRHRLLRVYRHPGENWCKSASVLIGRHYVWPWGTGPCHRLLPRLRALLLHDQRPGGWRCRRFRSPGSSTYGSCWRGKRYFGATNPH